MEAGSNLPAEVGCNLPEGVGCNLLVEVGCNLPAEVGCNLLAEGGCNLPEEVLAEGNAVLVGKTWSTSGWPWSTRTFEFLVEIRRQLQGNDSGSTGNMHNNSKPRWK